MNDYTIVTHGEHPHKGILSNVKLYNERKGRFLVQGYHDPINDAYFYYDPWNNELVLAPTVPAFEARVAEETKDLYKRTGVLILGAIISFKLIKRIRQNN